MSGRQNRCMYTDKTPPLLGHLFDSLCVSVCTRVCMCVCVWGGGASVGRTRMYEREREREKRERQTHRHNNNNNNNNERISRPLFHVKHAQLR